MLRILSVNDFEKLYYLYCEFSFFQKGASIGTIFALVSGEGILGSPGRDIMGFKYFGWKAFVSRLILCAAFVIVGSFVAEVLLW